MKAWKIWVPKRIEALCKKKRLSYYKLSLLSNVSKGCISSYVNGKTIPSLDNISFLCKGFGISEAEFFAENCQPEITAYDRRVLKAFHNLGREEQECMLKILERADRGWSAAR